jgi:hypothetical protein
MTVNDVVRFIIKNYPHKEDLSHDRIHKLIYLIDWKSAIEREKQITDLIWQRNSFGPYVALIDKLLVNDSRFELGKIENFYGSEKIVINLNDDTNFVEPTNSEREIIDFVINATSELKWNEFISGVFSTFPIQSTTLENSNLDLVKFAKIYNND